LSGTKRPVLSATIHPDLKRTLVAMSERTGMSVSQVNWRGSIYRFDRDAGVTWTWV